MKYKDYLEMRNSLIAELQAITDNGGSDEEYNAKKAEVEALDQKWEGICQRQADVNALADSQKTINIQALAGVELNDRHSERLHLLCIYLPCDIALYNAYPEFIGKILYNRCNE